MKRDYRKDIKKKIMEVCLPLTKISSVRGILLYGSTLEKGIRKDHDIDLLVIYDDSKSSEQEFKKINLLMDLISARAKKKGLNLHFQPPKSLSLWWKLIIEAEPWLISAIRRSIILYDPFQIVSIVKKLVKEESFPSINEKIERLLSRSRDSLMYIREKLVNTAIILLDSMTKVSQLMLSYLNIYTTSPIETLNMLEKNKDKLGIKDSFIVMYSDLIRINEKIAKGTLGEFRCTEIDLWFERVTRYVKESEKILLRLENEEKEKQIKNSYKNMIILCEKILRRKVKRLPRDNKEKISLFKKYFIDTNLVSKEYYSILEELYNYIEKGKPLKRKNLDIVYINSFISELNNMLLTAQNA